MEGHRVLSEVMLAQTNVRSGPGLSASPTRMRSFQCARTSIKSGKKSVSGKVFHFENPNYRSFVLAPASAYALLTWRYCLLSPQGRAAAVQRCVSHNSRRRVSRALSVYSGISYRGATATPPLPDRPRCNSRAAATGSSFRAHRRMWN